MIGRVLAATLTGGILAFVCGLLIWHVLPFHDQAIARIGTPGEVPPVLRTLLPADGVYRTDPDAAGAAVPLCVYLRDGALLGSAERQGLALAAAVGAAFFSVLLVVLGGRPNVSFVVRWLQFTCLGGFAAMAGPVADWLRLGYSESFGIAMVAGVAATWTVAGLGMAVTLGGKR